MFPFDVEEDEVQETEEKELKDYEIDFEKGYLTGWMVTGLDAIIQSIKLALKIDRYFYSQYSWEYGSELNTLIGKNYSQEYVQSEVQRMLEDLVLGFDEVLSISDIQCTMNKDKLTISFELDTIYGGGEISV